MTDFCRTEQDVPPLIYDQYEIFEMDMFDLQTLSFRKEPPINECPYGFYGMYHNEQWSTEEPMETGGDRYQREMGQIPA